ncbi:unnamed protein product [Mytilus coruscus]|uniref:Uncharacterized protein n=1 Tax=Mytilus coruscus TaxID=42192 RepID=A0A6J8CY09_MYTCO|nr:unnamed protein product [Mytilus coruscus]
MADVISTFKFHLMNRHNLLMHSIVFLRPNTLTPISEGSDMSRFEIRDLYMLNKLDENVITEHILEDDQEVENADEEGKCDRCFQEKMIKPLHWKSFNIIQEWTMDVPLDVQILLETFLNHNSLNRSNEIETLITSKLKKLYGIYDTLLNVYNRNYCGILQELNTQELSMNYQSIGTAFSIASSSGATLSLNAAEKKIKEKASSEMCYFNTYVRRYQLEYNTVAGCVKNYVIRLKHHTDPNPGESRSMQICTLPITLRGVPKDHIDVQQTWHTDHQCDQSDDCKCRQETKLFKEDVHTSLLSLSVEEDNCMKQFRSMMTWGLDDLWRNIMNENKHLLVCGQEDSTQNSDSALEDSLATLDIEDHIDANIGRKSPDEIEEDIEMELSGEDSDTTIDLDYEEPESNSSDYDQEENLEDILNELELSNIPDEDYEDLEQYFTPLDDSVDLTPIPENPDLDLHLQQHHRTQR